MLWEFSDYGEMKMIELTHIRGSNGALYMSRDGCDSLELLTSDCWGYFEWGTLIATSEYIEDLCERFGLKIN